MRRAFTLIELLVAMAVLAMMIAFASMIFKVSIDTYRISSATAEIMQKLRVVTDQLDADFKGLRRDAPLLIWFQKDNINTDPNRYDQIMFFADGDFSSMQLYDLAWKQPRITGTKVIRGNMARIFYGQAQKLNQANNIWQDPWNQQDKTGKKTLKERILVRRQHIFDPNTDSVENWPAITLNDLGNPDPAPDSSSNQTKEDRYEHDALSLAEWKTIDWSQYGGGNSVTAKSFGERAKINTDDSTTIHKLLCEGIGSFTIQWAYWNMLSKRFNWFPNNTYVNSRADKFGVYFNAKNGTVTDWDPINNITPLYRESNLMFFPAALKFTFTLYDSKGVIRDGMVFSHIVYLGQ